MKSMDDLPKPTVTQPQPPVGSMAKETAPPAGRVESPLITGVGSEVELSPEVKKAGVTVKSDTITVPAPVQQLGVTPVGPSMPAPSKAATTNLPLSDDQIAKGLHQSIMSSWRWLAEWCKRQLLQAKKIFIST
jgi:hypothetical protein